MRRRRLGNQGATGPEFAVCCTAVLILITAIIDYGTLFSAKHAINYALVKAARYAAIHSRTATTTSITAMFNGIIVPALGSVRAQNCTLAISYPTGNSVGATVVLSANFQWTSSAHIDALPAVTIAAAQTLTIEN